MKKFEKLFELGIDITGHRIDKNDAHVFVVSFDRDIKMDGKLIRSVEYHAYLVTDVSWFSDYYPCSLNSDNDVDLFEDEDNLFNTLFTDSENLEAIVQDMCIDYCTEHKLPNSFMDTDDDDGDSLVHIAEDISDAIKKSEVDIDSSFTVISDYWPEHPYKRIKFEVTNTHLKLDNPITGVLEFDRSDDETDINDFLNSSCIEFSKKWNTEIIGKFDWKLIEGNEKLWLDEGDGINE